MATSLKKSCIRLHYTVRAKNEKENGHAPGSRFQVFFLQHCVVIYKICKIGLGEFFYGK
jgi:hypothetical protein